MIRIVPKKEIKKAYQKEDVENNFNYNDEWLLDKVEKVPNELFPIVSEVVKFIEKIDKEEE